MPPPFIGESPGPFEMVIYLLFNSFSSGEIFFSICELLSELLPRDPVGLKGKYSGRKEEDPVPLSEPILP